MGVRYLEQSVPSPWLSVSSHGEEEKERNLNSVTKSGNNLKSLCPGARREKEWPLVVHVGKNWNRLLSEPVRVAFTTGKTKMKQPVKGKDCNTFSPNRSRESDPQGLNAQSLKRGHGLGGNNSPQGFGWLSPVLSFIHRKWLLSSLSSSHLIHLSKGDFAAEESEYLKKQQTTVSNAAEMSGHIRFTGQSYWCYQ